MNFRTGLITNRGAFFLGAMLLEWFFLGNLSSLLAQEALLLSNANIVDPKSQQIRAGHLLIADRHIQGTLSEIPEQFGGKIIDLQGKWIIPGLNELHTHSFGNRAPKAQSQAIGTSATAQLLLSVGVTSLLDLFGRENRLYQQRQLQRDQKIGGADIFTSLSCLTATRGHCTEYGIDTRVMDTPEQAIVVVSELARKSPDVIKIVYSQNTALPTISKATLKSAVETARSLAIKTVIHISSVADMRDAIEVGASALTHLPDKEVVPDDVAALMAKHHVASIPTLAVDTDMVEFIKNESVLATPMARYLATPEILNAYHQKNLNLSSAQIAAMSADNQRYYRSTKNLSDAGVLILTGSDSGNYGTIQGYSVHRELIKLVKSGLSNWQALAASTINAGEFLGKNYGVNKGDEANLVILTASPIENIANTQKIAFVVHHGRLVEASWSNMSDSLKNDSH